METDFGLGLETLEGEAKRSSASESERPSLPMSGMDMMSVLGEDEAAVTWKLCCKLLPKCYGIVSALLVINA